MPEDPLLPTRSPGPALPPRADGASLWPATLLALLALAAWDASGLDIPLAQLAGGPHGFALRDHWLFTTVLHDGLHRAAWLLAVALCLGVWWPFGALRRLDARSRLQLAVTTLATAFAVVLAKQLSPTSCPWDLAGFGGTARYLPHWAFMADGGPGHCFPAGHASSGFSFVGGFFAFRHRRPTLARTWLAAALTAGLALGWSQQLRGAHFMSHTLWTGWLCWVVAWGIDRAWPRRGPVFP